MFPFNAYKSHKAIELIDWMLNRIINEYKYKKKFHVKC